MEQLLSQWTQEQNEIASKVKIRPDDPLLLRDYPGSLEFSSHATLASSSSLLYKDKLIGGVDVSFAGGDNNSAVAVYVITRDLEVIYSDSLVYTVTQCYVSSFLGEYEMMDWTEEEEKEEGE